MRTKISKIAKDLNVGVGTAAEFLRKHNIDIDNNPNSRIDDDAVALLTREFSNDKADKAKSDNNIIKRREGRKKSVADEVSTAAPGLRVLGKIDLDAAKGGARKDSSSRRAPKEEPKAPVQNAVAEPAAPKAEPKPAPAPAAPVQSPDPMPVVEKPAPKPEQPAAPAKEARPKSEISADEAARHEKDTSDKNIVNKKFQSETKNSPRQEKEKRTEKNPGLSQNAAQAPKEVKTESAAPAAEDASSDDEQAKSNVFRLSTPPAQPELKVLGKIDLSALNQSTRPKKEVRKTVAVATVTAEEARLRQPARMPQAPTVRNANA